MDRVVLCSVVTVLLITCGLVFAAEKGSVTGQEMKQEVSEAVEKAKTYTVQQKQAYRKEVEAELTDLTKRIAELESKAQTLKGKALEKVNQTIVKLKAKRDAAQNKLMELGAATASAWDEVKKGLDMALRDLQKAYSEALKHFQK